MKKVKLNIGGGNTKLPGYTVLDGKFIDFNLEGGEIPLWVEFITDKRDELIDFLGDNGVSCRKPWTPLDNLPNSNYYAENCVWLPNGPSFTEDMQEEVIKLIEEFYGRL